MRVRLSKEDKIRVANTDDVFEIMRKILMREGRLERINEHFWVVGLDVEHRISFIELIALGRSNCVHVNPLDVFHLAAAKKLPWMILVHNHPGGELEFSDADKEITERLVDGGKLLGITVLDHIIMTEDSFTSLVAEGLM